MNNRQSNHNALIAVGLSFFIILLLQPQQLEPTAGSNRFGVTVVQALPSGAAGCVCCGAAAFGFHLDYGPTLTSGRVGDTGSLAEFNTTLYIDDDIMSPNNITILDGGKQFSWVVTSGPDLPIRGVLMRVQPVSDTAEFTLTGDANLHTATACFSEKGNVEGITHRTRVRKQNATGTMRFDNDGLVDIDLTVVYMNGRVAPGDLSLYAYSGFQVQVKNSPPIVPVPVPVAAPPTASPVEDRCATNACKAIFGLSGKKYNRFRGGQCRERCAPFNFLALSLFGWKCGGCF